MIEVGWERNMKENNGTGRQRWEWREGQKRKMEKVGRKWQAQFSSEIQQ